MNQRLIQSVKKQAEKMKEESEFISDGTRYRIIVLNRKQVESLKLMIEGAWEVGVTHWLDKIRRGKRPALLIQEDTKRGNWLIDGHHRREAYLRTKINKIPAILILEEK